MTDTPDIHVCEYDGCESVDTMPCYLPREDYSGFEDEPSQWYCGEHVYLSGYCAGCGCFYAGTGELDFSNFCEWCRTEFHDDDDYEDDDLDGWEEYPAAWYDGSPLAELEDTPTHIYIGPRDDDAEQEQS